MEIKQFVFNPFYENTILLISNEGNCLIFDPGCYETFELKELTDYISAQKLTVKAIINTHCHIDHVLGNYALKAHYKVPLQIPINEKDSYHAVPAYAPQWGITGYTQADPDAYLEEGGSLTLDELQLEIIEVPGHSLGHQMFYEQKEKIVIGGDVLFRESIGRTDLPGGDHATLLSGIRKKVFTLPDNVTVYPGHGPETTIGHEKAHNPFLK